MNTPIEDALAKQEDFTVREFEERAQKVITELMEQGLNAELYYKNKDPKEFISLVPTSAHTGEGVQDLLLLMIQSMQEQMLKRIMWQQEPKCTLLEVKAIDGLGTTIDVVLLSGRLRVGDTIVCCGINGPIVTTVRALLTPKPMKEMRIKVRRRVYGNALPPVPTPPVHLLFTFPLPCPLSPPLSRQGSYVHHDEIEGAMGIKIAAHGVEHALAGTSVLVKHPDDEVEDLKVRRRHDAQCPTSAPSPHTQRAHLAHVPDSPPAAAQSVAMSALRGLESLLQKSGRGVHVQASTLGSLEALLEFLRTLNPPIPVAGFSIGPVHRRDVMQASIMLEHQEECVRVPPQPHPAAARDTPCRRRPGTPPSSPSTFPCPRRQRQRRARWGSPFSPPTSFTTSSTDSASTWKRCGARRAPCATLAHTRTHALSPCFAQVKQRRREESSGEAVFPCELSIYKDHVFAKRNPILLGVRIQAGILKKNTPLAVVRITSESGAAGDEGAEVRRGTGRLGSPPSLPPACPVPAEAGGARDWPRHRH